jgi:hypothetical protein
MSHYARKGYKVSSVDRYTPPTHLWTLQKKEDRNDGEKNDAQEFEVIEEGEHGRLALDHVEEHAVGLRGRAGS